MDAHPLAFVAVAAAIAGVVAIGVGLSWLWPSSSSTDHAFFAGSNHEGATETRSAPGVTATPEVTPVLLPPSTDPYGVATITATVEIYDLDKVTVRAELGDGDVVDVADRDASGEWTWVIAHDPDKPPGWVATDVLAPVEVTAPKLVGHLLEDEGVATPVCSSVELGVIRAAPQADSEPVRELRDYECLMRLDLSRAAESEWLPVIYESATEFVSGWIDSGAVATRRDMLANQPGVLHSTVLDQPAVLAYVLAGRDLADDLRRPRSEAMAALVPLRDSGAVVLRDPEVLTPQAAVAGHSEAHPSGCHILDGAGSALQCVYAVFGADGSTRQLIIESDDAASASFRPEATITTVEFISVESDDEG